MNIKPTAIQFVEPLAHGAMCRNPRKRRPNQPDFVGSVDIGDQHFSLSAWARTSAKGNDYLSLCLSLRDDQDRFETVGQGALFVDSSDPDPDEPLELYGPLTIGATQEQPDIGTPFTVTARPAVTAAGEDYWALALAEDND